MKIRLTTIINVIYDMNFLFNIFSSFKIKKPFKPRRFEGLHPVYLTLFLHRLNICCPQSTGVLIRQVF